MTFISTNSDDPKGLANKAASGTAWTTAQSVLNKISTLVAMYIIALQLTPDQFGMAVLTLSIGKFLVVLPPLTMGDLMIVNDAEFSERAKVGQGIVLRVGVIITIGIACISPLIALIYTNYAFGILVGLILVVSLRPTCEAFAVAPLSCLRIDLRYRAIAFIDGGAQFFATLVMVSLAFLGAGALSLVLPQIIAIIIRAICYRLTLRRNKESIFNSEKPPSTKSSSLTFRQFFTVGIAQYIHSILDTLPVLVLGRLASEVETGFYGFAFQLAAQVNAMISFQLGIVLQPLFGKLKDDIVRQAKAFHRSVNAISAIIVPMTLIQAALAEPLFALVFKVEWHPAAKIFAALSIAEAFYFATAPTIALLKAQGKFRTYFYWQITQLVISIIAYSFAAIHFGAFGVAVVGAILWGLSLPIAVWIGTYETGGTFFSGVAVLLAPWTTALPIAALVWFGWLLLEPFGKMGMGISIFIIGPFAFMLSFIAIRISQPKTYAELAPIIGRSVRRISEVITRKSTNRKDHH